LVEITYMKSDHIYILMKMKRENIENRKYVGAR